MTDKIDIEYSFWVRLTCVDCGRKSPKLLDADDVAPMQEWRCSCGARYDIVSPSPTFRLTVNIEHALLLTKHCPKCNQDKLMTDFDVDNSRPSGRASACKACRSNRKPRNRTAYQQQWREKNPDKYASYLQKQRDERKKRREALDGLSG